MTKLRKSDPFLLEVKSSLSKTQVLLCISCLKFSNECDIYLILSTPKSSRFVDMEFTALSLVSLGYSSSLVLPLCDLISLARQQCL